MELISTYSFSTNFPQLNKNEILRDNIIDTLVSTFKSNDIIFLTGDEEIGKTTFLGQFARKNYKNTISCFIKPINEFSTNLENIFYDLIAQIHFILTETEFNNDVTANSELLQKYLFRLMRSKRGQIFYLLLDGFEEVDNRNSFQLASLFNMLPFGYNTIKFLISDNNNKAKSLFLSDSKMQSLKTYIYPFAAFSLDEASRYLSDATLEMTQIFDILKITDGLPGRIKVIVDSMKGQYLNYEEVQTMTSFAELLDKQWDKISSLDDDLMLFLATIAFEQNTSDVFLMKLLSVGTLDLKDYIERVPFIEVDNGSIKFTSAIYMEYVRVKLHSLRNRVSEIVISYLNQDITSINSILELPKRLEQEQDYKGLLNLMTDNNFEEIIKKKESLSFIEEQTDYGIRAASVLKNHVELYRLTLQKSCIMEVKKNYIWKAEIEAKIELKDFESVNELVNQSIFKEDKFKLLVFIAKKKKTKGLIVEENILDSIKTIYSQIDIDNYFTDDEKAELASELLYVFPSLAIEIIDRSSGKGLLGKSDWGFANLALLLRNIGGSKVGNDETLDNITSRITSPSVKKFSDAFAYLYGDEDIESFLLKCEELDTNIEKLHIIRLYLTNNVRLPGIEKVISYGLDILLLASTEIPVSATILNELSKPILYIEPSRKLMLLCDKFDSLKAISKEKGPTVNHIKYCLNLAIANIGFDESKGNIELFEVFEFVDSIKDIGIQIEGFTILYSYVSKLYRDSQVERIFNLDKDILPTIVRCYDYLIDNASQHFEMAKPIIHQIAKINPSLAIDFCKKINTRYRRDNAYLYSLTSYVKNDVAHIDFYFVDILYQSIIDVKIKNEACIEIISSFAAKGVWLGSTKGHVVKYIDRISGFYQSGDKFEAYLDVVRIIYEKVGSDSYTITLVDQIKSFIMKLEDRYEKIEFGFGISVAFIRFDKSYAILFHDLAEHEKSTLLLDSPITSILYFNAIRLSFSAFTGVVRSGLETECHIYSMLEYISFLPNLTQQKDLTIQLLFILHTYGKLDLCKKFYDETIKSFLQSFITNDNSLTESEKFGLVLKICPLAYIYQRETISVIIEKVPAVYKDFCFDSICEYIISKNLPGRVQSSENLVVLSIDDALSVLHLLKSMTTDNLITHRIDQIRMGFKNVQIPKETLVMISMKIQELISSKLPDSNNITHDGYLNLCEAYILSINNNQKEESWKYLFDRISKIPNRSDKVYVMSIVASILPQKLQKLQSAILKNAFLEIDNISSYTERVHRYSDLKAYIKNINVSDCKFSLRKAINDSLFDNDTSMFDVQKSIVDFAYEISEDFADELMTIIDIDPARKPLLRKLRKSVKTMELRDSIVNDRMDSDFKNKRYLSEACAMLIVQLNSNRISSKHVNNTVEWLLNAYKHPISETFPIYMCFVENINSRFAKLDNQNRHLTEQIYNQCINNVRIIKVLAIKNKNNTYPLKNSIPVQDNKFLVVKSGEREKALNFIRKWAHEEVVDYLKICDPYFTFEDLQLVKEIFLIKPETKFIILGQYNNLGVDATSRMFSDKWFEICDQDPPEIKIVMVGLRGTYGFASIIPSPNHDRWYVTFNSGLTVGTSFKSLGIGKNSSIQIMSSGGAKNVENEIIDKYLKKENRFHGDVRLLYDEFSIN